MNQLAPILKKARQALNLTQEDVAKRLGISQRAYSFYEDENLERMPRPKRLEELGKVLNIPIKTVLKYYNGGLEEETIIEEQEKPSQQHPTDLLTGAHVTLQDYINKLDEHNAFLQYVIKNGLVSLDANLKTGQLQIQEQLFAVGESLGQQLEGLSSGFAALAKDREVVKKDKDISGKQRGSDGRDKSRS